MLVCSRSLFVAACTVAVCAVCAACGSSDGPGATGEASGGAASSSGGASSGGTSSSGGVDASGGTNPSSGGSGGALPDPDPVITADARAALAALRYDSAAAPLADPSNKYADNADARTFGQRLFFEKALSGRLLESDNNGSSATLGTAGDTGKVSCSGCHLPNAQFVDVRSPHQQISLAAQWTRRRTPTLLEVGFEPLYNWDGRRDTLWNQAIGVFENAAEFNSARLFIAQQIYKLYKPDYEKVFGNMPDLSDADAFPPLAVSEAGCEAGPVETALCRGKPGDKNVYDAMTEESQTAVTRVTVNVAKALSAYVRQLRCGSSRFDDWLDGTETALSRSEQRGAALFVGAGKCTSCHTGPNLSDGKFHNVGLRPSTVAVAFTDTNDRGAAEGIAAALTDPLNGKGAFSDGDRGFLPAAVTPAMEGAFRTPTLRCVANQPSFMHTAQHASLAQVVRFFNRGGDPAGFPGTNEIAPLGLSDLDVADLAAFLAALEGEGPDAKFLQAPAE